METTGTIRRYKRYKVELLDLNGQMLLARQVNILDISLGGLSIQTDRRINSQTLLNLQIQGRVGRLNAEGSVVWSFLSEYSRDNNGSVLPIYKIGVKFIHDSEEKIKEILDFIEANRQDPHKTVNICSPDGRRLHVRIPIEFPHKSVLRYQEWYRIKTLSLGGMLIESMYEIDSETCMPMEISVLHDKVIQVAGKVASCLPVNRDGTRYFDIGIAFLNLPEESRKVLKEFLETLDRETVQAA